MTPAVEGAAHLAAASAVTTTTAEMTTEAAETDMIVTGIVLVTVKTDMRDGMRDVRTDMRDEMRDMRRDVRTEVRHFSALIKSVSSDKRHERIKIWFDFS